MRILSAALLREKNQVESSHVWTMAFEVNIPFVAPYRLINYDQDLVFHGLTFQRFPVDVDALEDANSMALVRLRITIGNVDRGLQALLENYWNANTIWSVTIWQLDAHAAGRNAIRKRGSVYAGAGRNGSGQRRRRCAGGGLNPHGHRTKATVHCDVRF